MHLAGLTEQALIDRGEKPAHARALVSWFAGRGPRPKAADRYEASLPGAEPFPDPDGTVKFAVRLADGATVETVLIQHPSRTTVCVSSQAGCARGCVFCETGRSGLQRNLTAAEIVAQYALVAQHLRRRPQNVVFMGMGEPLDNLDQVLQAIAVLREHAGFAVPERRITVSTVGIVPRMDELYARTRAQLAVSLHAIDAAQRRALLPVARKWPLSELREAIARAPRTVLLQWTLIEGVNDADSDADALAGFSRGLDVRVNLIPLNPGPIAAQRAPPLQRCRAFQKRLADAGVRTLLRMPHGQQVGGACGQLAGARRSRPEQADKSRAGA
jgi:23S rRNA (adenine2503-C2)-methyltransferase